MDEQLPHGPSHIDLLEAEIAVIWGPGRRTTEAPPSVVIGDAGDGVVIEARNDLDPAVVREIRSMAQDQQPSVVVGLVQGLLRKALGPLEITVGPGYDCSAPAAQPEPSVGRLIRSDVPDPMLGRLQVPPTWDEPEWSELLDGRHGPWAMVVDEDRMLSLCHSARLAAAGVEAGTWTAVDARGHGLAAAATAAWADACRDLPGHIFYSTDANNLSSQRVAARLKLPLLGQLWKLRPADEGDGPADGRLSVISRSSR
ncbi:GNAT family N-acetyltransferase [Microlunatus soli]|uniref:Acetyltransferase (GNAT) domain-containing protein n=1 Tax=Microlunatus soli TaxID=630515 RepID=A0A1H1VFU4_9ACTN|nr:GNAT family N-acetyltransferase [Microlunatus soli]SDS83049.1 Acetyltransferase (GNAT) domain-containing protein [Microlunatus soli]